MDIDSPVMIGEGSYTESCDDGNDASIHGSCNEIDLAMSEVSMISKTAHFSHPHNPNF